MTPEEDKRLCKEFPILYAQRHGNMRSTSMCWGFECGSGWFKLVRGLSAKLEAINRTVPEDEQIHAMQVKEKFGTLRFYTNWSNEKASDLIDAAEKKSARICETCGRPGKLRGTGWLTTLCSKCWKKSQEAKGK